MGEIDLSEWTRWYSKYVQPVFLFEERDKYYQKIKELQVPFYPKFWLAEKFYNKIKNDIRFDETQSMTNDGLQMSDPWISANNSKRIRDAVGPDLADDIIDSGYKRILAKINSDGSVIYKELDEFGNVIGSFNL